MIVVLKAVSTVVLILFYGRATVGKQQSIPAAESVDVVLLLGCSKEEKNALFREKLRR